MDLIRTPYERWLFRRREAKLPCGPEAVWAYWEEIARGHRIRINAAQSKPDWKVTASGTWSWDAGAMRVRRVDGCWSYSINGRRYQQVTFAGLEKAVAERHAAISGGDYL